METENRLISLEYFFTCLLFLPLLFFFPQEALFLWPYLLIGIIIGVAANYFNNNQTASFKKSFTFVASLLVLSWAVYAIFKSTFLYREVIVICIKSLSILVVINGLGSSLEGCLSSMQIFSILLFFCLCALIREYNKYFLVLIAEFIFVLSILTKIKLDFIFSRSERIRKRQAVSFSLIIVLFLALFVAWILFLNVPLREIKTWGYSKDEELISSSGKESGEKSRGATFPDDQLQKELTSLTLQLSSADEMRQLLVSIQNLLVQQTVYAGEIGSAEREILQMVDNSSLMQGQGKGKLSNSVKAYVDKKILNNLAQIKEGIGKVIQENKLGIWQKLNMLSLVNKIEYSDSLRGINKYNKELRDAINDKDISRQAKEQLNQLNRQFKEWKTYQAYRDKAETFAQKIDAFDKNKRNELKSLADKINDMDKTAESASINKEIENLRGGSSLDQDKLLDAAQEIINLKNEMLALKENSQLRKKLESSQDVSNKLEHLRGALDVIEESQDQQEVIKKIGQLLEEMKEAVNAQLPQEGKDILEAKLDKLIKESLDAAKKQIRESNLSETGENLLADIKKMASEENSRKMTTSSVKIQKSIEALYKQDKIDNTVKDNLLENVQSLEQLSKIKSELMEKQNQKESVYKNNSSSSIEKAVELLQNSSLEYEQKELLDKLAEKLSNAQTVSQVEDVLLAIDQQIDALSKKENTKDLEKMKELIQKSAQAKKSLLQNSSLEYEQKELLDKLAEKLSNAQTVSQVEDVLLAIDQQIDALSKKENTKDLEKMKELMREAAEAKKSLFQNSTLEQEQKELLNKLMDKLANAQTVSQVEDALLAINQQIDALSKKGDTKDLEKIKELMQKAAEEKKMFILGKESYDLRKKIEDLKNILPQQASFLEENLDQMKTVKAKQDLIKNIDVLNKSLATRQDQAESLSEEVSKVSDSNSEEGLLKLYLLPDHVVLSVGASITLESVLIFNNFIRDVGAELEWASTDSSIAFVDQRGLISALGVGRVEIICRYKGSISAKCKITVVEEILQSEANRIKNELGKQEY